MPRPLKRGILGASTYPKILINMLLCVVRIFMKQTLVLSKIWVYDAMIYFGIIVAKP